MGNRQSIHVKVDEETWEEFQSFVVEAYGTKYGNLGRAVERALSEYMDHDRYARIENRLDEVVARLDEMDSTHTHTNADADEKVRRIVERIAAEDATVIPSDVVTRAIEEVAGVDDRTIEKWKTQLKRRGEAYKAPSDEVWFLDVNAWVSNVESYLDANPTADFHDVTDPYPIGYDEYERLAGRPGGIET